MLPAENLARVLCIAAHPDDIDYGAAGTVAALTGRGIQVSYCVITDGQAGQAPAGTPRAAVADLRRTEQRAAAALVGVTDLTFLGYTDGELTVSLQLRRDLARAIRRTRPDVVISTSPQRVLDRFYFSHPDHLAAGEATLCAIYPDARNEHAHPSLADEGWQPWTVPQVWLVGHEHPNLYQDVTDTYPSKLAAILAHGSQHPPGRPPDALDAGIRAVLGAQAEVAGLASGRLAEAFRLVVTA